MPEKMPTPPTSPKKAVNPPARAKSLDATAVQSKVAQGWTVRDLADFSRGPIGNRISVEGDIDSDNRRRLKRVHKLQDAIGKEWSRPYTTRSMRKR